MGNHTGDTCIPHLNAKSNLVHNSVTALCLNKDSVAFFHPFLALYPTSVNSGQKLKKSRAHVKKVYLLFLKLGYNAVRKHAHE